jgi:putative aldouronate transport system substrate-binding protein
MPFISKDFILKENNELTHSINVNVENANYIDYLKVPVPELAFTSDEISRLAIIKTDLDIYMKVFEEKIVTNKVKLNDTEWDKHLDNLSKLKVNELINIYESAYARYINN